MHRYDESGDEELTRPLRETDAPARSRRSDREALRRSEERLQIAAEAAQFAIYDADLLAGTLYWSPEVRNVLGIAADSPLPAPGEVAGSVHPEDVDRVRLTLRRALDPAGDGRTLDEHRIVRPDGAVRWVQIRGQVQFAGEGAQRRAIRSSGIVLDITERKEAEQRLAADLDAMTRLQRLGALFVRNGDLEPVLGEIVEAAIAIAGADFGNIQLLDPRTRDLHIAAQRGFPAWWLDYWNAAAKGQGSCGTALERGERIIVDDVEASPIFVGTPGLDIQLRAGVRAVQSTPLVSRSGKPLGMFSTHYRAPQRPDERTLRLLDLLARQASDIIERVQSEEVARRRSEELTALLDALPAYVWFANDAECRVISGNRAANEMTGVEVGANVSQSVVAIGKAHYLRQLKTDGTEYRPDELPMQQAIATRHPVRDAYIDFRFSDGRRVEAVGSAAPLFDATGTARGAVAAFFDITALRQAEQALQTQSQLIETVVRYMPAAVCLIRGSDLRLRLINPAYQAIAPGKEMVGKTLDELWPETGQDFTAICRRVLETGEPHQVADELNMIRRRPDGPLEAAYFSWSVHRVRLPGEEGWGLVNAAWETTERKLSEAALRDTEERLRLFIEYAPVSLAMFDLQMRYLGASRRWVNEYLGGTTDFIGHAHYEVFPDCPERWRAAHRRGLAGEIVRVDEDAWTMANGQTLWARYEVRPWYAAGGTIGGIVIFTEDITGRKQAEAALRESRENLDRAQEVGLIGWWRQDTRTNVLTWSEQNYRIFGVPVGSPLTYDSFLEIVHPEDRAYVDSQWKAGLRGAPYDMEHRIVVGARVKWVREKAFLEFDTDGSLSGGFGITQDITERREAEKALRESEARFQLASEIGRSGTWDWDVTSGKVVWSRGHFEILGYEPGAVTPSYRAWADRVHPADLPGAEEEIRRTMAEHADYIRQFRVVWHDGSTHWMSARARYEYDVDGTCRRMLGVMADVTELKEAERQAQELSMRLTGLLAERTHLVVEQAAHLRELAVELTQAEQRERDRLYELLHDHVQPLLVGARLRLSALDGGSTIEAWVGSAAEVREHITAALNTARSLSVELNPPLVRDVGLGAALDWLRRSVKTHHGLDVQLKCESAAEPADAASRLLLFKAVRELLLNVAKHARTDKVSITMQVIPERMVQITVADRGVGFDAAARAGNQCAQAGSGLYDIGRRLGMIGGSIDIESEPGVGTTIRLTVPLAILASRAQRGTGAASLL